MKRVPFCLSDHKMIPELVALHDLLTSIDAACVGATEINFRVRIMQIQALAADAVLEVNKLCLKDIEATNKKECV